MQSSIAVDSALERLGEILNLVQFTLLDRLVNAHNLFTVSAMFFASLPLHHCTHILPDYTASANVQVSDFTVSHETLGKTDSKR